MVDQIVINDLAFSYGNQTVLENVSLRIKENEIVTIIGPNGGGKTTLLRLIAGLLNPDKGIILVKGKPPKHNHGVIGYVPQHSHFDNKYPITVFEVILSGLIKPFGFYSKEDKITTEKMVEYVGLESVKNRPFDSLSGGQSQRMLIARALVSDAHILLLDEPTSNIDSSSENSLRNFLKDISKKLTVLIVTHDTGFVSGITDRVFCVNRQLVEHPIDSSFSQIVSSSYGLPTKMVRHDQVISHVNKEHSGNGND
ncbi:MAG: ABC transporter ATP-binding protein [Spirochaetes bacterium]|nr:ABC transporter ATP-binding protein [Spirochaetota bacterium]